MKTTYTKNIGKAELRRKFIALNATLKKKKTGKMSNQQPSFTTKGIRKRTD